MLVFVMVMLMLVVMFMVVMLVFMVMLVMMTVVVVMLMVVMVVFMVMFVLVFRHINIKARFFHASDGHRYMGSCNAAFHERFRAYTDIFQPQIVEFV
jgi:hypothetical protein